MDTGRSAARQGNRDPRIAGISRTAVPCGLFFQPQTCSRAADVWYTGLVGSFMSAPVAAAAVSAGMQAGMSVSGNVMSYRSNRLNREWQERMSNTAHQREVSDLRAAGINPILTSGGSGATSPMGTPWDPDLTGIGNAGKTVTDVALASGQGKIAQFSANQQAKRLAHENAQTLSAIDVNSAQTANIEAQTLKTIAEIPGVAAHIANLQAQTRASNATAARQAAETEGVKAENVQKDLDARIYGHPLGGPILRVLEKVAGPLTSGMSAGAGIKRAVDASRPVDKYEEYEYDNRGKMQSRESRTQIRRK